MSNRVLPITVEEGLDTLAWVRATLKGDHTARQALAATIDVSHLVHGLTQFYCGLLVAFSGGTLDGAHKSLDLLVKEIREAEDRGELQ